MKNNMFPVIVTIEDGEIVGVEIFEDRELAFEHLKYFDSDFGIVRKENGEIDRNKCMYDPRNTMYYSEVELTIR